MTDHSTPTSEPPAAAPDRSLRVVRLLRLMTRWLAVLAVLLAVLLLLAFLGFRLLLLPNLDRLRPQLETLAGEALGMPVKVGRIDGSWLLTAPQLTLHALEIRPDPASPPIRVARAQLVPSWQSWLWWEPRLSLLNIQGLTLDLQRRRDGSLLLNGVDLAAGRGDGEGLDWLLRQGQVQVRLQRFTWRDDLLGLPPLSARAVELQLRKGLLRHQLQLTAKPDSERLSRLELAASWRGGRVRDWREWDGDVELQADAPKLSWLQRYLPDAPFSVKGAVSSALTLQFAAGRVTRLQGAWQAKQVALALAGGDVPLPQLAGQVDYRSDSPGVHRLRADHLQLQTLHGTLLQDASVHADWHETRGGRVSADRLALAPLLPLLQPHVPALQQQALAGLDGQLHNMSWRWQGRWRQPAGYRLATRFSQLQARLRGDGGVALQGGLDGELSLGDQGGQLRLNGNGLQLALPTQLAAPLQLSALRAELGWQRQAVGWRLQLPQLTVHTPDFRADIDGELALPVQGASRARLAVRADAVRAERVPAYLPNVIGSETVAWLRAALQGGMARNVRASLDGELAAFPFADGKGGRFSVDADIEAGKLRFDPAWPVIEGIAGRFAMRNDNISVDASRAHTAGVALRNVAVRLPRLEQPGAVLHIDGQAAGALPTMLAYTRTSPVDGWLDGFLATIASSGDAGLKLGLTIPLDDAEHSKVQGSLQLAGNSLRFTDLPLPELTAVSGVLGFSERGVFSPGIRYQAFGGSSQLRASLDGAGVAHFVSEGEVAVPQVLNQYAPLLARYVTGSSAYRARFSVGSNLEALEVDSGLQGASIQAPAPLAKAADAVWPLAMSLHPDGQGWRLRWQQQQRAQGEVRLAQDGSLQGIAVGVGAAVPDGAGRIAIHAVQPELTLAPWLAALPAGGADSALPLPLRLQLDTPQLLAQGKRLHDVSARLDWAGGEAPLRIEGQAREAAGKVQYQPAGHGRLSAQLSRLVLPLQDAPQTVGAGDEVLPALDVQVDELRVAGKVLGELTLKAQHQPQLWLLDEVRLAAPEALLTIHGAAPAGEGTGGRRSELAFQLSMRDAGALLTRLGQPDTLQGGAGELSGTVQWLGQLTAFDLSRLSGGVKLNMSKGRFSQIDPGAGRLLGLLSLQSLSRRIRLDFTDVFSSGFAFDSLTGSADIDSGVFRSRDLQLQGPAAKVSMQGEADLANNRQQVRVRVTPALSEGVAVLAGATALNPLLGAVTFAAQKLLQDPVSQILSFEYEISGSLTEPQVRKLGQQAEKAPATP